jgi:hypothetical protein
MDTSKLKLCTPVPSQGTFFSKLLMNNNDEPVYIQTPKCKTKQGIVKTGKRKYTDLLFTNHNEDFVKMISKIEDVLQELISEKQKDWFVNEDLDKEDIQNSFISPIKVYQGKNYLLRVNLNYSRSKIEGDIPIFNDNEMTKTLDDITQDSEIICILEILGIKFSQKYFQIEINIKQIMIIENQYKFDSCLIKTEQVSNSQDAEAPEAPEETQEEEALQEAREQEAPEQETQEEVNLQEVNPQEGNPQEGNPQEGNPQEGNPQEGNQQFQQENSQVNNELKEFEVDIKLMDNDQNIELKEPNDIYMKLYLEALDKAKVMRSQAIEAYLVAKNIKNTYALDIDDEDEYNVL